jgi:membrane protein implicated in regulation of membrane protease activity
VNRLWFALAAYVALAVLAWVTLTDQRIRLVTLGILAMFLVKTLLHRKDVMQANERGEGSDKPM